MREEVEWWIEDAKRSLIKAEKYFELGFYEDVVFNCQQALEKLFKGLWLKILRKKPIKTHKIIQLYKPLKKSLIWIVNLKIFSF